MKRTAMIKDLLREIKKTWTRFLSTTVMIALGVFILVGLKVTGPMMSETVSSHSESQNMYDILITSPIGISKDDVKLLNEYNRDKNINVGYFTDVNWASEGLNIRLENYSNDISSPEIVEGRAPNKIGEILIEKTEATDHIAIGDKIEFLGEIDKLKDDEDPKDLKTYTYEVVGKVLSTDYMMQGVKGVSSASGVSLETVAYIDIANFNKEKYSFVKMNFDELRDLDPNASKYKKITGEIKEEIKTILEPRSSIRFLELIDKNNDKIKDGEEKIVDAKAELADAEDQFKNAKKELDDAKIKLEDAKATLKDADEKIKTNEKKLIDAEADAEGQINDAKKKIADGKVELDKAKKDMEGYEKDYSDGLKKYNDGLKEYEDAVKKLEDAQKEIDKGWVAVKKGEQEAESGFTQAQSGLSEAEGAISQLEAGISQVEGGLAQARAAKSEAESGVAKAEAAIGAVNAMPDGPQKEAIRAQAEAALAQAQAGLNQANGMISELQSRLSTLSSQKAQAEAGRVAAENGIAQAQAGLNTVSKTKSMLNNAQIEVDNGREKLIPAKIELDDAKKELDDARAKLDDGKARIEKENNRIKDGEYELAREEAKLNSEMKKHWAEINDAKAQYQDGLKDYADGEEEYSDGKKKYDEKYADFLEKKAEAEVDIADGERKIADARDILKNLKEPKFDVQTRKDNDALAFMYESSQNIDLVSYVFPLFFFFIAILVSIATMTRMVEENRINIGTYKALGYGKAAISFKFIVYGLLSSLIGGIIGASLGSTMLTKSIYHAYSASFVIKELTSVPHASINIIAILIGVFANVFTVFLVIRSTLKEPAANLLRAKAPRSAKKTLIEKIHFIWNRLKFLAKVSMRNVFRYKSRMFMTIFGLAGCTGLLFLGFSLREAIGGLEGRQFGEIYKYDITVITDKALPREGLDDLDRFLNSKDVDGYTKVYTESLTYVSEETKDQHVMLVVPEDSDEFINYVKLRHDKRFKKTKYLKLDQPIITSKLKGIIKSDEIVLEDSDFVDYKIPVLEEADFHIGHYIFMSKEDYEKYFDRKLETNAYYIDLNEDSDYNLIMDELGKNKSILAVTGFDESRKLINDWKGSINIITLVILICSAALAFVVLYNLTNINIEERLREISTIKVLGFRDHEVVQYIYRETYLLALIGILLGYGVGWSLLTIVSEILSPDNLLMNLKISFIPYLLSALITMLFVWLVRIIVNKRLRGVDMVEALKSYE